MRRAIDIILADDDKDDHFLFQKALNDLDFPTHMHPIYDGEKLMRYLSDNLKEPPDIIFLDLNMPRKNGSECLTEIKGNVKLKHVPIVIYSTSFHEDILDLLYQHGADHCIRKRTDPGDLKTVLRVALKYLTESNPGGQPSRDKFVINEAIT